ncbi:MAG: hypothetical protein WC209_00990 [Ignavibacteriaceae bacterium]|jgi:hypothetical protein
MFVQTINPKTISKLPELRKQIELSKDEYAETKLKFIRPYCVAYLDQAMRTIRKNKEVLLMPIHPDVHQYLKQCGFEFLYGKCKNAESFNDDIIVPLIRFIPGEHDEENIINWLDQKVIKFIPQMNRELRKKIVENFWEIVYNAFVHSESEFGISACGQLYPQKGYFELAFYDGGVGLAKKIKKYGAIKEEYEDYLCIEWALKEGTSTTDKPSAGLGLHFLREFLKINQGNFQFISGKGYFGNFNSSIAEKIRLDNSIEGTLINIRIIFDNK